MCFIQKLAKFLWKGSMGQPVLSLNQIFQKMLETDTKYELLMEIDKTLVTLVQLTLSDSNLKKGKD